MSLRIAFIVSQFPTLSETFILNQITGLLERGHQIDIYAMGAQNVSKVHADVEKHKLLDRTYYFPRIPHQKLIRVLKGVELVAKYLHKAPVTVLKSLNIFKYGSSVLLKNLYTITPFLDKGQYDIIHCHYGPNGKLAVLLREIGAIQGKIIVVFHGFDMSVFLREKGDDIYNDLFVKADLFLPVSKCWQDKLLSLGCNEQKIMVHRMGINPDNYSFCPKKSKGNDKIQLLTVARLTEKKGVAYAIQAVTRILKEQQHIEYNIVGDGPLQHELSRLIEELNVGEYIKLIGWKEQAEIIKLMQSADIFLAPSVASQTGNEEGIPVAIMEAMAQGLPVISTWHSGISELVQDGQSGFLVPERDVDALTEKLSYLLLHRELWAEMGYAGRRFVEAQHDINKLNDRLVELYQDLINCE